MTITTPAAVGEPIDVWLKLAEDTETPEEDLATHEANTYATPDGFVIEWYLNSVGLVKAVHFDTIEAAHAWYAAEGFEDFSS